VDGGNVGFPIARLDARLVGRWAARLVLAGLAPRERFGSDEAGVDVARTRVSAALTYDLVALGRGGVYVGAGVGSSSASVTGHTSADDLTRSSTFITALAEAVIGARLALGSRVAFVTEAAIRHELPRTRLFVLERAAAAAGGESLSLEAAVVVSL
jgi:hypothetical protein